MIVPASRPVGESVFTFEVGREGVEPLVAASMFFDAGFTDRPEEHDPLRMTVSLNWPQRVRAKGHEKPKRCEI